MKFVYAAAVAALLLAAAPAHAQVVPAPAAAVGLTHTEAGRAAAALLEALNGDPAARAAFVRGGFTARALQNTPAEARIGELDRLVARAGGFVQVEARAEGGRMVEVIARAKTGGRFARFVVFTSRAEPGKIADVFVLAARDPARVRAEAWPTGELSDAAIGREIHARVQALVDEDQFSGAVLVARGDKVLFRRAYGPAEAAFGIANRPDTAFNVASMGKMFTAVAAAQLIEQGRLSPDDTVAKLLPEFPDRALAEKITVRHLLTHASGLGDLRAHRAEPEKYPTGRSKVPLMTEKPAFEPGTGFQYSNAGYILLGAIVEAVSGQTYDAYVAEHVFAPAGMTRTDNAAVNAVVPNRATGYLRPADDPLGYGPRLSNVKFLGLKGDGSGGAYSTVDDLLAFKQALFGHKLLSAEWTQEVLTPRVDFPGAPRPSKYGYGFRMTDCAGKPTVGHGGGGPNSGVDSLMYVTADGEWTVIVLSNYDPPAADDLGLSICEFVAGR